LKSKRRSGPTFQLTALSARSAVSFVASAYRDKIRSPRRTLAEVGDESRQAAFQGSREFVEKIVIHPRAPYEPVELEIFGQLAAIL
jgi:hypothetical protein